MTPEQHTDLQDLASGLRGAIAASDQLSHDRATHDQLIAAALYMSRKLYDLVHNLETPPLEDEPQ